MRFQDSEDKLLVSHNLRYVDAIVSSSTQATEGTHREQQQALQMHAGLY
jgi:hypothetical protein